MYALGLGLGIPFRGGGVSRPALSGDLRQKLSLTAQASSPQPWLTVSDSRTDLTIPTLVSGNIRQADAFFTAGSDRSFYNDVATTSIVDKSFEHLLIHYYNTNGSNGLWVKKISDTIWRADQYIFDIEFIEGNYNKNIRYYKKGGGALRDSGGDLILDGSGFVIFVLFEDTLALDIIPPPELIPDLTDIPT